MSVRAAVDVMDLHVRVARDARLGISVVPSCTDDPRLAALRGEVVVGGQGRRVAVSGVVGEVVDAAG